MTDTRNAVERELDQLTQDAAERAIEAYLRVHEGPLDGNRLVHAALVTGMDMAMAFAVEFPAEARTVLSVVERGAGLTEADLAQRMLLFQGLVDAARTEQ
jgi:hypothetical protein